MIKLVVKKMDLAVLVNSKLGSLSKLVIVNNAEYCYLIIFIKGQ